ncbi:MAG: hypothetical protein Q9191_006372 [Dirinaria sp. TL-2023a]
MSSAWWLGQHCMLGLSAESQTTINLKRTKQCVLNLASEDMVPQINTLAKTSGRRDLSPFKLAAGYRFVKDKFELSKLTRMASELVKPPRVAECKVQMEAELVAVHEMNGDDEDMRGFFLAIEVKILCTYAQESLLQKKNASRVDADSWKPMVNIFQHLYGLSPRLPPCRLAEIDEEMYSTQQLVSANGA